MKNLSQFIKSWCKIPGWIWVVTACLASISAYLLASFLVYQTGYPLDDAWIHQTYARNLGLYGEWSFLRGVPSAGSTSPFWTFLLALGYTLRVNHYYWAMFLGFGGLLVTSMSGQALYSEISTGQRPVWSWVAVLLAFEWHLVWASASGMETGIYGGLVLLFFYLIARQAKRNWLGIGLMIGGLVWLRPDAITLLGPAIFVGILDQRENQARWKNIGWVLAGFFIGFLPYLVFNYALSGSLWPNTFYAKQAEYEVLYKTPLFTRLLKLAGLPLIGGGVLMVPGFLMVFVNGVLKRKPIQLAGCLWWMGYTAIYAMRLPVVYQHGRYLIPAMSVFFVLSLVGLHDLSEAIKISEKLRWAVTTFWKISLAAVLMVFWGVGANAYAEDVAIIETEMVETAAWLNENTPKDALIAVHDIGAIGYFADRKLVDLAGLISPEVVPFIRDEQELANYMNTREVDYLVTFPGWYPLLTQEVELVYESTGKFSPKAGGENMTVYRWNSADEK